MTYIVKEIFYTLQGEGHQAGRPAVFCRFTGCNLWSGKEADRHNATCQFCDTDFVGIDGALGGKYKTAEDLAVAIASRWPTSDQENRFVVCTGGEPLLQLDAALINQLHLHGFSIAIETNGTILPPAGIDWICVSPKAGAILKVQTGNELKFVFPQNLNPHDFENMAFDHFAIQPMDGPDQQKHLLEAIDFCLRHPKWTLSLQTHKMIGVR